MTGTFAFPREERLRHDKLIARLFNEGRSFIMGPLKVFYADSGAPTGQPCQVLISVPRRKFKRAVDRNRIRRKVREAYRLNRYRLQGLQVSLIIGFVYIGHTPDIEFRALEDTLSVCLERLAAEAGKSPGDG